MQETECIPYSNTGYFSSLILDYLAQKTELKPFYNHFPSLENFKQQIAEKEGFAMDRRQLLQEQVKRQYKEAGIDWQQDLKLSEAIGRLGEANCFTVTTGHQLNILTGPLYFIYKIVSTINLALSFKREYPQYNFVPVFWMASEDHDFEEISFVNLYGGRLSWQNNLKGPVGRMPNFGMGKVLDELEEHLGTGDKAKQLLALFREAYHEHNNLSQATRLIVSRLFEAQGLLILDGDDPKLKASVSDFFQAELTEQISEPLISAQSMALEKSSYFAQVKPRDINLFYIKDGLRERIEKKGDQWLVLNTDLQFSAAELEKELADHPERFSPNAALRPLYQEMILPNLAYIGGGGELAYWFQLKALFDHFDLPMPMLVLRNSVLWVEKKWQNRLADMGLGPEIFFQPLHQLKKQLVMEKAPVDPHLHKYEQKLEQIFDELEDIAKLTEKSMLGAVNAQRQKQLNGLDNLKKKLLRAEKRRQAVDMDKLDRIYHALFPNGGLQERHDTLAPFYAAHGVDFIKTLLQQLKPLQFEFSIIRAK